MAKLLEIENLRTQFYTSSGVVAAVDGVTYDVEEGERLRSLVSPGLASR